MVRFMPSKTVAEAVWPRKRAPESFALTEFGSKSQTVADSERRIKGF